MPQPFKLRKLKSPTHCRECNRHGARGQVWWVRLDSLGRVNHCVCTETCARAAGQRFSLRKNFSVNRLAEHTSLLPLEEDIQELFSDQASHGPGQLPNLEHYDRRQP